MTKLYQTILMILLIFCLMPVYAFGQKMMSVQVRSGDIRSTPSFLGTILSKVSYGDRLLVRDEKGSWVRVSAPGKEIEGWIHSSALTNKMIALQAGASDVEKTATSDELALAGRGFSKQVEKEFREKNPHLDFITIDKMEKIRVSQNEIQNFLKAGELAPKGGYK